MCLYITCRGDLLSALQQLDKEDDVNKVLRYFSYEHFYVIYCKVRTDRNMCMLHLTMPMTIWECRSPFHTCAWKQETVLQS